MVSRIGPSTLSGQQQVTHQFFELMFNLIQSINAKLLSAPYIEFSTPSQSKPLQGLLMTSQPTLLASSSSSVLVFLNVTSLSPEPFRGNLAHCGGLLLHCFLDFSCDPQYFPGDSSKTSYLVGFLSGTAFTLLPSLKNLINPLITCLERKHLLIPASPQNMPLLI